MKKTGILNKDLSETIAGIGHTDQLVICDAGFPIPSQSKRIDLALKPGLLPFLEVLDTVLQELEVEKIIIAEEMKQESPNQLEKMIKRFPNLPAEFVPHVEFKEKSKQAKGIVRTGECIPYSNIILVAGVTY